MISSVVDLIVSFLPIWQEYLIYVFVGEFVAFVGCFIHSFFRG